MVERPAIKLLQNPPKSRPAAMCMMKDVEPFTESRNSVLRVSRRDATKTKVARGHHPGKGRRMGQIVAAAMAAAITITITNR